MKQIVAPFLLASVLGLAACSSSGTSASVNRLDTATASVETLRTDLAAGGDQVDTVMSALVALNSAEDLRSAFRTYSVELDRLLRDAEKLRARRAAMETRMQDHIDAWGAELEKVSSESAREVSEARRTRLSNALFSLTRELEDAKAAYQPFASQLQDIRLVLANELSPAGVEALSGLIDEAEKMAVDVREALSEAIAALDFAVTEFR